jgi:hypothetical protein
MKASDAHRRKYDGLLSNEIRRLKQLKDENVKLRKVMTDLTLDAAGRAAPKASKPGRKRKLIYEMRSD